MQLFTRLGLATGFKEIEPHMTPGSAAGLEWDIRDPEAPYIVKSPWLCDYLDSVMESGEIIIDHAIIPMRDLFSAAESRRDVARRIDRTYYSGCEGIQGGLWHTDDPEKQEIVLTEQIYKLMHALAKWDIPTTLLYFPRMACEPESLYQKMKFLTPKPDYDSFLRAFNEVARPELIHIFQPAKEDER